jgi:crossover junction endonuclease EME1
MNLETSFCIESGQVRAGEDKDDTFVKMLQEIVRITPPIAYGIASEYPSVIKLVKAFRRHGPTVLEDLQVYPKFPQLMVMFASC